MQFMILRKADPDTEAGVMPSEALLDAMASYNERLVNAGALAGGAGLKPSEHGARVKFAGGKTLVTDGPFAETREVLAGYTLIEADSMAEALDWVRQWPPEDAASHELELEVRPLFGLEDFAPGAAIDHTEEVFDRMTKQPVSMSTYLKFSGNCRQAFEYYAGCLGGTIDAMMTFADAPAGEDPMPAEFHDLVMHASLRIGKFRLLGSDASPQQYTPPQGTFAQMSFETPAQAREAYANLSKDAQEIIMPLAETFFAECFGMFKDQFGIPWMIIAEKPETIAT